MGYFDDVFDLFVCEIWVGDCYLVCFDGFMGVVCDEIFSELFEEYDDLVVCVEVLVSLVLCGGGVDNIICVVVYVVNLCEYVE